MSQIQYYGNLPPLKLAADITNSASTFNVNGGTWPTLTGVRFVIEVGPGLGDDEKILCSDQSGGLVTVAPGGRGYDGTTAVQHTGGEQVISVFDAASATDFSRHVYTTTDDDHLQYARTDGTRALTGNQHFNSGLTVIGGGITVPNGGGATALQGTGVTGALAVSGNETVGGTLGVSGALTASSTLAVAGAATVGSTLGVTGKLTGSAEIAGSDFAPAGLGGSTQASRYVGATAAGAPTSGTYTAGDWGVDKTGAIWVCTTGGTAGSGAVFKVLAGTVVARSTFANVACGASGNTIGTLSVPVVAGALYLVHAYGGGIQSGSSAAVTYITVSSSDGLISDFRPVANAAAVGGQLSGGGTVDWAPSATGTPVLTLKGLTTQGSYSAGGRLIVQRVG